jgi:hypothetical protein
MSTRHSTKNLNFFTELLKEEYTCNSKSLLITNQQSRLKYSKVADTVRILTASNSIFIDYRVYHWKGTTI